MFLVDPVERLVVVVMTDLLYADANIKRAVKEALYGVAFPPRTAKAKAKASSSSL